MSTKKILRKRTSQINYTERTPRKKIKVEEVELHMKEEDIAETVLSKQPIIAPDGKNFYPCQHCSKIFRQKTTCITHMKKCPNKSVELKNISKYESSTNNNVEHPSMVEEHENLNISVSNSENKSPQKIIKITQNIVVKEPFAPKEAMNDSSVYDYNEQDSEPDSDEFLDEEPIEGEEDSTKNKFCKHCKTVFDTPLELFRHKRDRHNFPKKLLPPDELEKYFDSPNRNFCPVCEKPIKTRNFRSVFIKHLLVHTTGFSHECSVCKKKFKRRDHMRIHEKRHIV